MSDNMQRSSGIPKAYRLDRGNAPTQTGIYIGEVRNTVDSTRSGRIQVWIEDFAGPDKTATSLWRTVSPVSPFYGVTNPGTDQTTGNGEYVTNRQSYGMWFTPPDIGTRVICFFASGDANYGYYIGSIVEPGLNHMLPAVGASTEFSIDNGAQKAYFQGAKRLPVVEANLNNPTITDNPRFFDLKKPVHSVVAGAMLKQGLIKDEIRGPISSNAQRESPSAVYGISTPGRPIYQGGVKDDDIQAKLNSGSLQLSDVNIVARRGGHSIVLDDGDLTGKDALIRFRSAAGHQITMSDSGNCIYFVHANGQSWIELGAEGTVDVYAANSVNIRSQGDLNFHADRDINMFAGRDLNTKSGGGTLFESNTKVQINAKTSALISGGKNAGLRSDGSVGIQAGGSGSFNSSGGLKLNGSTIDLNGSAGESIPKPTDIAKQSLDDVEFQTGKGWVSTSGKLQTIVSRAPTHEPYAQHGRGVMLSGTQANQPPAELFELPMAKAINSKFADIKNTPIDAISPIDYEVQPSGAGVGPLGAEQVTGIMAQSAKNVSQPHDMISNEKGFGKYGLSPSQLETAGYIKPGTVDFYLKDGAMPTDILTNNNIWTGKNGVGSATDLLSDAKLQDVVQIGLLTTGYKQLLGNGIITGREPVGQVAGLIQLGSKYTVDTVSNWVSGNASPSVSGVMDTLARGAQFGVELVNKKINSLVQGFSSVLPDAGYNTNPNTINTVVSDVINNQKV